MAKVQSTKRKIDQGTLSPERRIGMKHVFKHKGNTQHTNLASLESSGDIAMNTEDKVINIYSQESLETDLNPK